MPTPAQNQKTRDMLRQSSNVLVFTYALSGLGHLRVTDALYHGLPIGSRPLALGSQDTSLTALHRLTSIHPVARSLFEWSQKGIGEDIFTTVYRWYLRKNTDLLYKQLKTLIDQRYNKPKCVLIVATHFSLAHQLAEVKDRLNRKQDTSIVLVVQVTDDSPQKIWYVQGADLMVVPSYYTKRLLSRYGRAEGMPRVRIVVNPYPLSTILTSACSLGHLEDRAKQLSSGSRKHIHFAVPISGAAVGLTYAEDLIRYLHAQDERYRFHVVSKKAKFTEAFLSRMRKRSYVSIYSSSEDKKVVEAYEHLYKHKTISLEMTKPSEQAFKALVTPQHNGGSILLFTEPVGRQEYDNINFLRRHDLIPTPDEHKRLFMFCKRGVEYTMKLDPDLFSKSLGFRGIQIPSEPREAFRFIQWGIESGLFMRMASCKLRKPQTIEEKDELGIDGVERFWQMVTDEYLHSY